MAEIGIRAPVAGLDASLQLQQAVFGKVGKRAVTSEGGPPDSSPSPQGAGRDSFLDRGPGGSEILVRLARRF